jgi:hypothetical protein
LICKRKNILGEIKNAFIIRDIINYSGKNLGRKEYPNKQKLRKIMHFSGYN